MLSQCEEWLRKYDADQSGKLSKEQLTKLLTDLDGTPPTDEEVEFIIKIGDKPFLLGTAGLDGELEAWELVDAIEAWSTYTQKRDEIDEVFRRYDKTSTGQLNKSELQNYLTALNGDVPVSDAEVEWVLGIADLSGTGQLNKPELMRATAEWYTYVHKGKPTGCCWGYCWPSREEDAGAVSSEDDSSASSA